MLAREGKDQEGQRKKFRRGCREYTRMFSSGGKVRASAPLIRVHPRRNVFFP